MRAEPQTMFLCFMFLFLFLFDDHGLSNGAEPCTV
jgi:hypothetical protein